MAFRVGMKVGFIGTWFDDGATPLDNNSVYTIHSFCGKPHGKERGIHLCEVANTEGVRKDGTHRCSCYNIKEFRPIIERKTDTGMAILRKLLDGNKIEEKV